MTITTPVAEATVRRVSAPLLTAADLPPTGHFVGGGFDTGTAGQVIDVIDPCTESAIAQIPRGVVADVDRAVAAAVSAQQEWDGCCRGSARRSCTGSPTASPRTPTCWPGSNPPTPANPCKCRATTSTAPSTRSGSWPARCARPPRWPPGSTPTTTSR